MPLIKKKIVPSTLRQQIVKEIRHSILHRSLLPGERLIEREMASRLGISLTAVREALIQLEMEGLVTKKPNSATYVTELTSTDLENIYEVRSILEHYAFQEAARAASHEDILRLEALYEKTLEAARSGDGFAYNTCDLEWHEAVWRSTGNRYLADMLHRLIIPLFGFSSIVIDQKKFDLVEDAQSHAPLLAAICTHDPFVAGQAFKQAECLWRHRFPIS